MKRTVLALLLALLCLSVCACRSGNTPPTDVSSPEGAIPSIDPPPPPEDVPIAVDTLRVEIASCGDVDALIAMEADFAALLQNALAAQDCTVGTIELSFGASADATAQALAAGSVDVAWLDAGAYIRADGLRAVLAAAGEEGSACRIYASDTAAGRALAAKEPSWDDLRSAKWVIRGEDSLVGCWLPSLYLADNFDGHDLTELRTVQTCDDFDAVRTAAKDKDTALVVLPDTDAAGLTLLARVDGGYVGAVAVAGDSDWDDANFIARLRNAVLALLDTDEGRTLLEGYGHYGYSPADDGDFDALRRLATMGYDA